MKYLALRIDPQTPQGCRMLNRPCIRGQRETDYNWDLLYEAWDMETAIKKAFEIKEKHIEHADYCPIYDVGGYAIDGSY